MIRVGLLAYGTMTGLGYQTRALHDHLGPDRTLVIDLSRAKGLPLHREWFPGARFAGGTLTGADMDWFLTDVDVIIVCETPITYELFSEARRRGVRSILQYNYEFLDYFHTPWLPKPTVYAAPSPWCRDRLDHDRYPIVWDLPVPIDPTGIPRRTITDASTILHVAGRPAHRDRNGTLDFIALAARCKDLHARWIITCQETTKELNKALTGSQIEIVGDQPTPGDLYTDGDLMVLPRRYGGLCMPALESVTAGIPVIMPSIDPNTSWLPADWLVPASKTGTFRAKTLIDIYQTSLDELERLVRYAHANPSAVSAWSTIAATIAESWTWSTLLPLYRNTIERAMTLQP